MGGGADDAPGGGGGGQLHTRPRRHVRPLGARIAQRCSSLSLSINRIEVPYSQEVTQTTPLLSDLHISGEVPPGSGVVRRYLVVVIPRGTHVRVQLEGAPVSLAAAVLAPVWCSAALFWLMSTVAWFLGPLLRGVPLLLGLLLRTFPSASTSAPVSPSTSRWFRLGRERRNWFSGTEPCVR